MTRDPAVLDTCTLVVDVGGEFNREKHRYDHHQKSFTETLSSLDSKKKWVTKLSSAGLVYCYFGREVIATVLGVKPDNKLVEKVFDKVYENFIEEIDAIDNGISTHDGEPRYNISTNLSSRVGHLAPTWQDPNPDFDSAFVKAMELTRTEFLDRVNYYGKVWWGARDIVNGALQARCGNIDNISVDFNVARKTIWINLYRLHMLTHSRFHFTGLMSTNLAVCWILATAEYPGKSTSSSWSRRRALRKTPIFST